MNQEMQTNMAWPFQHPNLNQLIKLLRTVLDKKDNTWTAATCLFRRSTPILTSHKGMQLSDSSSRIKGTTFRQFMNTYPPG
jgi:hypothetical protein